MIKAVFFDLDDTLYDQLLPFQLAVEHAKLNHVMTDHVMIEDIYKRIRRHSDRLWEHHVKGRMTLDQLRIERTTAAFADLGITVSEVEAKRLQQQYELEQSRLELRAGVDQLFEYLLSLGILIGVITNGPVEHQMNKIRALKLLTWVKDPFLYISDGIGKAKPDPSVFQYVQQQTMLQPDQLVYIGDAWHNDIAPSFQAGWTPIWLNARRQQPNPEDSHVKYLECQTIIELLPLLKRLKEAGAGCLL